MYHNNRYKVRDNNTISSKFLSHDIKNYHQFCMMHGLKPLIQSPTCVNCSSSTLIDHILTRAPFQKGVIYVGVSDHQLIFCTRKISKIKTGGAHKNLNFRSLKNYTTDYYKETLKQVDFRNYENFGDANEAYSNFFQKLMKSRLHNDKEIHKKSKYAALKLIASKKTSIF